MAGMSEMAGREDNYFNLIRNEILEKFSIVKTRLEEKEKEILALLERYEADYMNKVKDIDKQIACMRNMKTDNDQLLSRTASCFISESMHSRIIQEYEGQLGTLKKKYPEKQLSLMWNDEFANRVAGIGYLDTGNWIDPETELAPKGEKNSEPFSKSFPGLQLLEPRMRGSTQPESELKPLFSLRKSSPLIKSESEVQGKLTKDKYHHILTDKPALFVSTEDSYLINPKRMSRCPESGNIFITDMGADCVKVYTKEGVFMKTIGKGRLVRPFGICIWSAKVFISHEGSISIYNTEGVFKQKYTAIGSEKGEFLLPQGLDVASDGNVYICDGGNNRIQIMGQNLEFKGQLGKGRLDELNFPIDVKTTQKQVLVLDSQTICVHVFSIETRLVLSHISRKGIISRFGEVKRPTSLALINSELLIVCDSENSLAVFKISSGNLKRVIKSPEMVNPSCVAVDAVGSIVVVCERVLNGLVTCNFNI